MLVPFVSSMSRLATLAALGGVLYYSWRHLCGVHERRLTAKPEPLPERLQVWEGEGGQNQMPGCPEEK